MGPISEDEFTMEYLPNSGTVIGEGKSERVQEFEKLLTEGLPWAPFPSRKEWEMAKWLIESGVSQSNMDKLLKLQWVSPKNLSDKLNTHAWLDQRTHQTSII